MKKELEDFKDDVDHMIGAEVLPNQLHPLVSLEDLRELVSIVYTEELEITDVPESGTEEEQQEVVRAFTERVAMKVGVVCALAGNQGEPTDIEMALPMEQLIQVFTQLMRGGSTNVRLVSSE